jgi:hypothetical protein
MRRRWREPAAIAAEIERVRSLRLDALRRQWRLMFARVPPAGLSKDLLGRMIAARLQERAFGGLDRDSLKFLQSLARHQRPPRRQLKPGTVFVRYQGRRHTVTTVRDGFEWQGNTYPLSAIARAITGTAWSGPRFFALHRPADDPFRACAGEISKPKHKSAIAPDDGRRHRRTAHNRNDPINPNEGLHHASLLERLPQAGPGLLPDRIARRLLDRRAHRLPADQQGDRQSAASERKPASQSTPSTRGVATRSPRGST